MNLISQSPTNKIFYQKEKKLRNLQKVQEKNKNVFKNIQRDKTKRTLNWNF